MKNVLLSLIVLVCLIMLASCGRRNRSQVWYDYGNGVVNLSNITHVQSKMTLAVRVSDESGYTREEYLASNDPITPATINKIKDGLDEYSVKWATAYGNASVTFDNFELRLPALDPYQTEVTGRTCKKMLNVWLDSYQDVVNLLDARS